MGLLMSEMSDDAIPGVHKRGSCSIALYLPCYPSASVKGRDTKNEPIVWNAIDAVPRKPHFR